MQIGGAGGISSIGGSWAQERGTCGADGEPGEANGNERAALSRADRRHRGGFASIGRKRNGKSVGRAKPTGVEGRHCLERIGGVGAQSIRVFYASISIGGLSTRGISISGFSGYGLGADPLVQSPLTGHAALS